MQDEFHRIENHEIHEFLNALLENLPQNIHIVISTRSDPPLRLARLRDEDQLNEIKDKIVALWTIRAAGEQNTKCMGWDTTFDHGDYGNGYILVDAQGHMVGEEVLRVVGQIERMVSQIRIEAEEKVVSRSAKTSEHQRAWMNVQQVVSINIHLVLVLIDHIALTSVSGEVGTNIYQHLKIDSPFTNTIMITMVNDRISNIIDDAASDTPIFETIGTPLQPGYAESAIVHGLVEMMVITNLSPYSRFFLLKLVPGSS